MRFLFVLIFTVATVFAATNTCPVTSSTLTRTVSGGPTYSNIPVPGSSTTNNLGTLGAAGCTTIDLTFSNFTVAGTGPAASGVYLTVTPTATTQTGPDVLLFSTLQGTGLGLDGAINDGVNNFKRAGSTGSTLTSTLNYNISDSVGTGIFDIVQKVNAISVPSGASGTVTLYTCLKGTGSTAPTGAVTTQAQCNTAVGGGAGVGVFQSSTITLSQTLLLSSSIIFASHPTYTDLTRVITLTCTSCGGNELAMMTFSDQFDETPEPSTLVLLGTSLALLGLLRFRAHWRGAA